MSFNPHTHAGCDKDSTYNFEQAFDVSIHTPTQGVTKLDISNVPTENVSIHTPTQGVTVGTLEQCKEWIVSIHTPTQGVTKAQCRLTVKLRFQSTHPRRV